MRWASTLSTLMSTPANTAVPRLPNHTTGLRQNGTFGGAALGPLRAAGC